jgi:hypothetical protein
MTVITPSWIFLRVTKTGSETVNSLLKELCVVDLPYVWDDIWIKGPTKERFSRLSADEQSRFIFGPIRNPWGWYYSFWNWYHAPRMQEHVATDHRIIPTSTPFEDWVRGNPEKMAEEMRLHYPENPRLVRVENLAEELIIVLEEAGESISEAGRSLIRGWPAQNVDKERSRPYESFYTEEMKELVLWGAASIFDAYYPDRCFPEEM